MVAPIQSEQFTQQLSGLLQETFEKVEGIFLDRGTSLLETLVGVSAEEASKPITGQGTSIAAQVNHVRFYLKILKDYMDGQWQDKVDWQQSWTVKAVSADEWDALRQGVRDDYTALRTHLDGFADWNDERRLGGALAVVVHTAYHLGALRQIVRVVCH